MFIPNKLQISFYSCDLIKNQKLESHFGHTGCLIMKNISVFYLDRVAFSLTNSVGFPKETFNFSLLVF